MSDLLVVGCGLLGTSIGLAVRGRPGLSDVTLVDRDPQRQQTAVDRGAGRAWDQEEPARLVVVATPPASVAEVIMALARRDVGFTYTHVSSIQAHVQAEVESLISDVRDAEDPLLPPGEPARRSAGAAEADPGRRVRAAEHGGDPGADRTLLGRFVGGHPMAGREQSGPEAALADLFVGRAWAVCPSEEASREAVGEVTALVEACGATPLLMDPAAHDEAVALLSHLPQVVASALAAMLLPAAGGETSPVRHERLALAGPGLVDTTRLAASDPALWTEILTANASQVTPHLHRLVDELRDLAEALEELQGGRDVPPAPTGERVRAFLQRGREGRALVPVKRGETAGAFARVRVELTDEPGQLAEVLMAAATAAINVEDLRLEHVPGRATGVVELAVSVGQEQHLRHVLEAGNWTVFRHMKTSR